jgi:putative transposon-encoded protein
MPVGSDTRLEWSVVMDETVECRMKRLVMPVGSDTRIKVEITLNGGRFFVDFGRG